MLEPFRSQGYQVLPGVIPPGVVDAVRSFLEREVDRATALLERALAVTGRDALIAAIDGVVRDGRVDALDAASRGTMCGHFPLETRLSPALWGVLDAPALRAALESLFPAQSLRMHMPPAARFVWPNNAHAGVPRHRDISYNRHVEDFVTVWVPLVDIDARCGGVRVFEGTHEGAEIESETEGFWLKPISAAGLRAVDCHMRAGDALLLSKRIAHESIANTSDRTRYSVDYRFFGDRTESAKHYLDVATRRVVAPQAA